MNNISTSLNSQKPVVIEETSKQKPSQRAINFLRQFARVYQSPNVSIISVVPGIVLN